MFSFAKDVQNRMPNEQTTSNWKGLNNEGVWGRCFLVGFATAVTLEARTYMDFTITSHPPSLLFHYQLGRANRDSPLWYYLTCGQNDNRIPGKGQNQRTFKEERWFPFSRWTNDEILQLSITNTSHWCIHVHRHYAGRLVIVVHRRFQSSVMHALWSPAFLAKISPLNGRVCIFRVRSPFVFARAKDAVSFSPWKMLHVPLIRDYFVCHLIWQGFTICGFKSIVGPRHFLIRCPLQILLSFLFLWIWPIVPTGSLKFKSWTRIATLPRWVVRRTSMVIS